MSLQMTDYDYSIADAVVDRLEENDRPDSAARERLGSRTPEAGHPAGSQAASRARLK